VESNSPTCGGGRHREIRQLLVDKEATSLGYYSAKRIESFIANLAGCLNNCPKDY
jgi:hypothetical protein